MIEKTLPQLEQLIEKIIESNVSLKQQVADLEQQKLELFEENETLQLEILECEDKQKSATVSLESLLSKLQSVEEVS